MIKYILNLLTLLIAGAGAATGFAPELAYCEKETICYLYNQFECTDPNCQKYHCCKFCWKLVQIELLHASNDTTDGGCPRMSANYRASLIQVGKGVPPPNFYSHQATRKPGQQASATGPPTTGSATPASVYGDRSIPAEHINHYDTHRHRSEQEGRANFNSGSTEGFDAVGQDESIPGTSVGSSASSTLRLKLQESERARKYFATEIKRLEEGLAATHIENQTLKKKVASLETDNLKLREQLVRSNNLQYDPSGRLAMPYQLTGPDRDMNQASTGQSAFGPRSNGSRQNSDLNQGSSTGQSAFGHPSNGYRQSFSLNQDSMVHTNPAAGDSEQNPFDIHTYSYTQDPNRTFDMFGGKRSGPPS